MLFKNRAKLVSMSALRPKRLLISAFMGFAVFFLLHVTFTPRLHVTLTARVVRASDSNACVADPNEGSEDPAGEPDNDECPLNLDPNKNIGAHDPSDDSNDCPDCIGDPVIGETGNNYLAQTDYRGAGPFPLVLTRYYNSQSLNAGIFGANWSNSFAVDLKIVSSSSVQVFRADQKSYTFNLSGGLWVSDADINARLVQTSDGWQYTTGIDETEYYDANGRLTARANRAGLKQSFSYDAQGRLATITDPFGRTLQFTYDGSGRIIKMVAPAGKVYSYGYNTADNLVSVTWPDGSVRKYVYENSSFPHALTGVIDAKGNRFSTYAYDAQGRAISSQHAGGAGKVTFDYSNIDTGFLVVANALGLERHTFYENILGVARTDSIGNETSDCFPDSVVCFPYSIMTHDANGNVASYIDPKFNKTLFTYDPARNLETSRTLPDGATITTTWDPAFRLPATITEPNRTTSFTYDDNGDLLNKTITAGNKARTWSYTYNGYGEVLTRKGPRTDVNDLTTFTYDNNGNVGTITDALSHVTKITSYDGDGRPLTMQDPNGLVTKLAYDARGRLTSRTVGTEVTSYSYDPDGELVTVTLPDASYIAYSYDAAHRLIGMSDVLGNRIVYTLDAMGNRVKEQTFDASNTLVKVRSHVYDALSRLYQDIGAQNQTTTYGYDSNGNLSNIADAPGWRTYFDFDSTNRLIEVTDPDNSTVQYGYDANNRLTSITDPLTFTTAYSYDGFNDLTAIQSPDSGSTTKTFDAAGNVLTSTDARGDTTTYTYDALNRPTSAAYADGKTITWQYDQGTYGIGRLTKMTDPSGSTTWSYDIYGRVVRKVQTTGTVTLTTSYAYDSAGHLVTMTYPSGNQLSYSYHKDGRVAAIDVNGTPLVSSVAYQPFGPVASWVAGNGDTYTRAFDQDGRVSAIRIAGNYTNETISLTYDGNGNITAVDDSSAALPNITADYGVYTYTYASTSNHLANIIGASTVNYTYDADGNTTSDGVYAFTYDARGRLVKVTTGAVTAAYAINGLGRRVGKSVSGASSEEFVYDDAGSLIGEYDGSGNVIEETVWLGGLPVGLLNTKGQYYINPDYLCAPQSITDQNDKTVWRWDHGPFGNGAPNQSPNGGTTFVYNLRFPGQYYDSETGLYYNMARDYNPATGRYLQSDPTGFTGGVNTYAYVQNDPVNYLDITGHRPLPDNLGLQDGVAGPYYPYYGGPTPMSMDKILNTGVQAAKKNLAVNATVGAIEGSIGGPLGSATGAASKCAEGAAKDFSMAAAKEALREAWGTSNHPGPFQDWFYGGLDYGPTVSQDYEVGFPSPPPPPAIPTVSPEDEVGAPDPQGAQSNAFLHNVAKGLADDVVDKARERAENYILNGGE